MKRVNLYRVNMMHKETKERLYLEVWAENVDEATHQFSDSLFGCEGQYIWRGSEPVYDQNGEIPSKLVKKV